MSSGAPNPGDRSRRSQRSEPPKEAHSGQAGSSKGAGSTSSPSPSSRAKLESTSTTRRSSPARQSSPTPPPSQPRQSSQKLAYLSTGAPSPAPSRSGSFGDLNAKCKRKADLMKRIAAQEKWVNDLIEQEFRACRTMTNHEVDLGMREQIDQAQLELKRLNDEYGKVSRSVHRSS